jgi:PHD/YefM family antitoxin component YafN of YafNO toxin-antitoxin module
VRLNICKVSQQKGKSVKDREYVQKKRLLVENEGDKQARLKKASEYNKRKEFNYSARQRGTMRGMRGVTKNVRGMTKNVRGMTKNVRGMRGVTKNVRGMVKTCEACLKRANSLFAIQMTANQTTC